VLERVYLLVFLIGTFVFLLPSVMFYAFFFIALKYFIIIFLSSFLLYFIVRVLMLYHISFKNALCCAFYAGTIMILIESILVPLNNAILVPVFTVLGMNFYVISYLLFVIFGIIGMVVVEKDLHLPNKKSKSEHKGD